MIIESKQHKEIVGHVNRIPYHVFFDAFGHSEVEQAVGEQLLRLSAAVEVQSAGLQGMSVADLRVYAKEHDITLGQARNKDDIIKVIEGCGEGQTDEVDAE